MQGTQSRSTASILYPNQAISHLRVNSSVVSARCYTQILSKFFNKLPRDPRLDLKTASEDTRGTKRVLISRGSVKMLGERPGRTLRTSIPGSRKGDNGSILDPMSPSEESAAGDKLQKNKFAFPRVS